jgi:hypothetical protein
MWPKQIKFQLNLVTFAPMAFGNTGKLGGKFIKKLKN